MGIAPAVGYSYFKFLEKPDPSVRVVHRQETSHLLVTSVPDGAEVFVDGKRVGRTPLFRGALTGRDQFGLRLQAPGFAPATRTLQRGLISDAHWHAVLRPLPRPAGADGGPR